MWQFTRGHKWDYDGQELPGSMVVRFAAGDSPSGAAQCDCLCDVCHPQHSHGVEEGCTCGLLACPCVDQLTYDAAS